MANKGERFLSGMPSDPERMAQILANYGLRLDAMHSGEVGG